MPTGDISDERWDRRLRRAFQALRRTDAKRAPRFADLVVGREAEEDRDQSARSDSKEPGKSRKRSNSGAY